MNVNPPKSIIADEVEYIRADRVEKLLEALQFYEPYEMEDTENALRRITGSFNDTGATAKKALEEYYGETRPVGTLGFVDMQDMEKENT